MDITRGIVFGNKHSFRDYGLYLRSYPVVSPPDPLLNLVDVPGLDGQLNLSTSLDGYMHYKSRSIKMQFTYIGDRANWFDVLKIITNDIHGKELDIYLDDDPGYRYHGVISIAAPSYSKKDSYYITVNATCDAYKYEDANSVEQWLWDDFSFDTGVIRDYGNLAVNGSLDVELIGCERPTYPDFVVKSSDGKGIKLVYADAEITLEDGTNVVAGLTIDRSSYNLKFVGNGTVSIVFDCGVL